MAVLDTCFVIDLLKEIKRGIVDRASRKSEELLHRGEVLRITHFTIAELFVGVFKSIRPERERKFVEDVIPQFSLLAFEHSTAELFGSIVGPLEAAGMTLDSMDALIGSVALERDQIIVTHNLKHFLRIPGLVVEVY